MFSRPIQARPGRLQRQASSSRTRVRMASPRPGRGGGRRRGPPAPVALAALAAGAAPGLVHLAAALAPEGPAGPPRARGAARERRALPGARRWAVQGGGRPSAGRHCRAPRANGPPTAAARRASALTTALAAAAAVSQLPALAAGPVVEGLDEGGRAALALGLVAASALFHGVVAPELQRRYFGSAGGDAG
ncbi:unnamed protein product [Prorocentrum cordatum]|uniref:NnrU domain-containing protein n=1 Tax=Prorocentrum cordatum TaxID=2364126 RepID=A0ABN9XPV9_9DINO|nr:unnamed protein product [Polarella glacialis]